MTLKVENVYLLCSKSAPQTRFYNRQGVLVGFWGTGEMRGSVQKIVSSCCKKSIFDDKILVIIQVYMPTKVGNISEINESYKRLEASITEKERYYIVVMRDWNAKLDWILHDPEALEISDRKNKWEWWKINTFSAIVSHMADYTTFPKTFYHIL